MINQVGIIEINIEVTHPFQKKKEEEEKKKKKKRRKEKKKERKILTYCITISYTFTSSLIKQTNKQKQTNNLTNKQREGEKISLINQVGIIEINIEMTHPFQKKKEKERKK